MFEYYWPALWALMGLAFVVAWLFIVFGCEVLDKRTHCEEYNDPDQPTH